MSGLAVERRRPKVAKERLPLLALLAVGFVVAADSARRINAQAELTVAIAALIGLTVIPAVMRGPGDEGRVTPPGALLLFLMLAAGSLLTTTDDFRGTQNVLIYGIFVGSITVTAAKARRWSPERLLRALRAAGVVTALVYLYAVAQNGPNTNLGIYTARAAAGALALPLVAALVLAVFVGARRWPALLIGLGIASTLSRGVIAVSIILAIVALSANSSNKVAAALKLGVAAAAGLFAVRYAYEHYAPFRMRFEVGDGYQVGTFTLGSSGRDNLWSATWDHWHDAVWLGHGAGSAEAYIYSLYPPNAHPHNDYLRILHDFGVLGLVLWVLGVLALVKHAWRGYKTASEPGEKALHFGAVLALLYLALEMVPDNPVTAIFVMLPIGVWVGASWGRGDGPPLSPMLPTSGRGAWSARTSR